MAFVCDMQDWLWWKSSTRGFGDTGFKVNTAHSGKVPTSADYATDKDVAELVDATIKYLTSSFSTSMEPPLSYFNDMNVPLWPYDSEELVDYRVGDIAVLVNHYRILFTDEEVDNIQETKLTPKVKTPKVQNFTTVHNDT